MQAVASPQKSRTDRFFGNVLWSWLGVGVNIVISVSITPIIIHRLGDEAYGIWTVVLSMLEYCGLLDLGFRSATIKYSAEYRATNQPDRINEVLNTSLAYSSLIGLALLAIVVPFSGHMHSLFQISPAYQHTFPILIVIVAFNWAVAMMFTPLGACLEGFQRFDLANRILIATNTLRSLGSLAVLYMGFGLIAMALAAQAAYIIASVTLLVYVRRCFPEFRLSPRLIKVSMLKRLVDYGRHTFVATIGDRTLLQAPQLLVGHFLPVRFAGYFAVPTRMMQYSADAVARFASVTGPNATELAAKGETGAVAKLGVFTNRYCLTIFLPMAIFFVVYGRELIHVWIKRDPDYAFYGAPLLPMLVVAFVVGMAAQYNSSAILYGMGKHAGYARGLLAEAVLCVIGLCLVVPHYGILGAAWVTSSLMALNRGFLAPALLCRHLKIGFAGYMRDIYMRPILTAIPVAAMAWALKSYLLPGRNWMELFASASTIGLVYLTLAFFFVLGPHHRGWIIRRFRIPGLAHLAG